MSRWNRIRGLTEAQRTVLLALLEADQNGTSAGELRGSCNLSEKIVYRALAELRRRGLARVVAERRLSDSGAWLNIWALTPEGVRTIYLIRRDGPRKKQTRWPSRRAAAARRRLAAEGRPFGSDQYS